MRPNTCPKLALNKSLNFFFTNLHVTCHIEGFYDVSFRVQLVPLPYSLSLSSSSSSFIFHNSVQWWKPISKLTIVRSDKMADRSTYEYVKYIRLFANKAANTIMYSYTDTRITNIKDNDFRFLPQTEDTCSANHFQTFYCNYHISTSLF